MNLDGPLLIPPLERGPELVWRVPGSKSITNRALMLAALAEGQSRLEGVLESDDTRHMRVALEAMGIPIHQEGATTLVIEGGRARLSAPSKPVYVGNSGTTVRFLAALASLVDGKTSFVGDDAMAKRPLSVLVDGLRQLGVRVECETGCPPLSVYGGRLSGGLVRMRGDRSSQYFSALLMASALADSIVDIEIDGTLVSRPYLDITCRMMEDFGGRVEVTKSGFRVHPIGAYRARTYAIEPDASSASYPFALAAVSGGRIEVPGLGEGALQGDYGFVDVLALLGAEVEKYADRTVVRGTTALRAVEVDMHHISDTVMTLAAIAPLCTGVTRIFNVANIRIKETDRLVATATELRRLGQGVTQGDDWLAIEPAPVLPATVQCYDDHRIAMSFAILGTARQGLSIENPRCVAKTYPGFFEDLRGAYRAVGAPQPW